MPRPNKLKLCLCPTTGMQPSSSTTLTPCECMSMAYIVWCFSHVVLFMPWAAPLYRDMKALAAAVQSACGLISSIPMLLVVDADSLELLTSGGRSWVQADSSAAAFPWRGQPSPPSDFGRPSTLLPMLIVSGGAVPNAPLSVFFTAFVGGGTWRCCRPRGSLVPPTHLIAAPQSRASRQSVHNVAAAAARKSHVANGT